MVQGHKRVLNDPLHSVDLVEARELYDKGWCDWQIADHFFVTKDTIKEWRRRENLPGHKRACKIEKPKKRGSTLVELAAEAKKHGMSYGEYMVARREGKV